VLKASFAAAIGIVYFREPVTVFRMASLALVLIGVIGLPLAAHHGH